MTKASPDLNRSHSKEGSGKISKCVPGSHQPLRCLGTTLDGCDWCLVAIGVWPSHRDLEVRHFPKYPQVVYLYLPRGRCAEHCSVPPRDTTSQVPRTVPTSKISTAIRSPASLHHNANRLILQYLGYCMTVGHGRRAYRTDKVDALRFSISTQESKGSESPKISE